LINTQTGETIRDLGSAYKTGNVTDDGDDIVDLTVEEKAFKKELEIERKKLAREGNWGASWNYIHNRYPEATNEEIDIMLDKEKYYTQNGKSNTKTPSTNTDGGRDKSKDEV
jgi:hypothetical protein